MATDHTLLLLENVRDDLRELKSASAKLQEQVQEHLLQDAGRYAALETRLAGIESHQRGKSTGDQLALRLGGASVAKLVGVMVAIGTAMASGAYVGSCATAPVNGDGGATVPVEPTPGEPAPPPMAPASLLAPLSP